MKPAENSVAEIAVPPLPSLTPTASPPASTKTNEFSPSTLNQRQNS